MRRRSRLLRVAKWGGVVVCGLLVVIGTVNLKYVVIWASPSGSGLATGAGRVAVGWRHGDLRGIGFGIAEAPPEADLWPPLLINHASGGLAISSPIWILLLTIGIPTIVLWRLDRRPLPGHCPCGYDLTGNVSGTCPECGGACASPRESR